MTLSFHQAEACEGIIQHLERREHAARRDVSVCDYGSNTSPDARVEMTLRLGDQLYAIEHTGIEPFDGFMEHQNRAPSLFAPLEAEITSALSAMLTPGVVIEMLMPIDAFNGYKMPDVRAIHSALVDWVRVTAPTLPPRMYADHRRMVTEEPAGVPFSVSLVRFEGIPGWPGRFQLTHLTRDFGDQRAIAPDETYMVSTHTPPWYAWPLLIDGHTYFDLAEVSHPIHFEVAGVPERRAR